MFLRTNCRLNVSVLCRIVMCVALRRSQEKWKIVHMLTVNQRIKGGLAQIPGGVQI